MQQLTLKSILAVHVNSHVKECKCKARLTVKEFEEQMVNDPGSLVARCLHCGLHHKYDLKTNLNGAELDGNLKLVNFTYCSFFEVLNTPTKRSLYL